MSEAATEVEGQRRHWRLMWLSSIHAFGDSETQRTRWLDTTEANPHFSFVECMCSYFDDAYLGEEDAYQKRLAAGKVNEDEVAAVAEFHTMAARYNSPNDEDWNAQAILEDPEWQALVDAAQRAQKQLLPLLTDQTERDALTNPLVWVERDGAYIADLVGSRIMPLDKWNAEHRSSRFRQVVDSLRRRLFRHSF